MRQYKPELLPRPIVFNGVNLLGVPMPQLMALKAMAQDAIQKKSLSTQMPEE